jgi:hypothetical protein
LAHENQLVVVPGGDCVQQRTLPPVTKQQPLVQCSSNPHSDAGGEQAEHDFGNPNVNAGHCPATARASVVSGSASAPITDLCDMGATTSAN